MPDTQKCAECGASPLISARVVGHCQADGLDHDLKLRVDAHPDALVFKSANRSALKASVCPKCGYTEFRVDDPEILYTAWVEAQKRGSA